MWKKIQFFHSICYFFDEKFTIFDYFRLFCIWFLLGLGFTQSQSSACLLLSASFIWSVHTPSSRLFLQQYPSALWHLNYIQSGLGFHVTSWCARWYNFEIPSQSQTDFWKTHPKPKIQDIKNSMDSGYDKGFFLENSSKPNIKVGCIFQKLAWPGTLKFRKHFGCVFQDLQKGLSKFYQCA